MQHQPTVSVIDMAHLMVAHGNKKKPKMFHPYNGMIAEPTEENIKKAASGNLSVSFLFLKEPHLKRDALREFAPYQWVKCTNVSF